MDRPFADRIEAGQKLAQKLMQYKGDPNAIVLGLPRGGVPIAQQVADVLELPLDIVVTRKIGAPFNEELAIGAISQEGDVIWNETIMRSNRLKPEDLSDTIAKEKSEAQRRLYLYRQGKAPLELAGKTVLLVDDGIATGATMMAAIQYVKNAGAAKIIVGTPMATVDTLEKITQEVDEVASVLLPKIFMGISAFYRAFPQTSDQEVIDIMQLKR